MIRKVSDQVTSCTLGDVYLSVVEVIEKQLCPELYEDVKQWITRGYLCESCGYPVNKRVKAFPTRCYTFIFSVFLSFK